jgi:rhamnosyltransferase
MISILIRNKNEAKLLEKTLLGIKHQKTSLPFEIVIIDDNSTDNSVEVAEKFGCKIVNLDKKFTYGYAINFGVNHCKYQIIILLSSHNILLSNDFFEKLNLYFRDENIAGVRCTPVVNIRQIEQSLINPILLNSNNYKHNENWSDLLIANCSAIRKSIAQKIIFNETIRSNEEKLWSLDVFKNGYSILSNVPCYYIYNKKNNDKAVIRDIISKYQIDGILPLNTSNFLLNMIKSIPWAIKIGAKVWLKNVAFNFRLLKIKLNHKKGNYN